MLHMAVENQGEEDLREGLEAVGAGPSPLDKDLSFGVESTEANCSPSSINVSKCSFV